MITSSEAQYGTIVQADWVPEADISMSLNCLQAYLDIIKKYQQDKLILLTYIFKFFQGQSTVKPEE